MLTWQGTGRSQRTNRAQAELLAHDERLKVRTMALEHAGLFPASTYLNYNHASYGLPALSVLEFSSQLRREIERDSYEFMGPSLGERVARELDPVMERLNLAGGDHVATVNVTEANNALASSFDFRPGDTVAMFSCEYESVIDAWQYWARLGGGSVELMEMSFPATTEGIMNSIDNLAHKPRLLLISAITSSHAIRMPLPEISAWCEERGVQLVVDAAHVVGHDDSILQGVRPSAVMASVHKWLPIPRSAGFLWVNPDEWDLTPSLVELRRTWPNLTDRFAWRGTWDPTANLCIRQGITLLDQWKAEGLINECERRADRLTQAFEDAGLISTAETALRPPRLRAFFLAGLTSGEAIDKVAEHGIRLWAGEDRDGGCVVRFATNIYQDGESDERRVRLVGDLVVV